MKKLLNTLFVTTPGAYISKDGETVVVRIEDEVRIRVPIHTLGGIVCFGIMTVSTPFIAFCAEHGVTISFLTEHGRFMASVRGPVCGNVLLRKRQYMASEEAMLTAEIARSIVMAKVSNSRAVLMRAMRDHPAKSDTLALERASDHLADSLSALSESQELEAIRGIEGSAAHAYFSVFNELIVERKEGFSFHERSRRPPLDEVNALLSFVYVLLMHDVRSAVETVGLDPSVGFLHRDRPGRYSLALDVMEEFRAFIADRLVLSLINMGTARKRDFERTESGAVIMKDGLRRELLISYQKRKQEEIQHPFLDERVPVGLLFHCQALLLARFLRGDLDGYPPYFWK